jgi:hypothetical protein
MEKKEMGIGEMGQEKYRNAVGHPDLGKAYPRFDSPADITAFRRWIRSLLLVPGYALDNPPHHMVGGTSMNLNLKVG